MVLLSSIIILARNALSSTWSGSVRSWIAALAHISYGRWSAEKPARCGDSIVILVPETTRLPMSTGSFGNKIRNGLKTDTATILAIDRTTAAGTATRRIRTIRLWRAALAKRTSIPATMAGFCNEFTAAPERDYPPLYPELSGYAAATSLY